MKFWMGVERAPPALGVIWCDLDRAFGPRNPGASAFWTWKSRPRTGPFLTNHTRQIMAVDL